ncbi:MAG: DUF2147 domain-containing protein [Pseudomonadota bacterium]
MKKITLALALAGVMAAGTAFADPIVGKWRTGNGGTVNVAKCGGSFCVKVVGGQYGGKAIGQFAKNGEKYNGTIIDPEQDKKYRGAAWFQGDNTLKMRGSVLGGLIGRTDTWKRM